MAEENEYNFAFEFQVLFTVCGILIETSITEKKLQNYEWLANILYIFLCFTLAIR